MDILLNISPLIKLAGVFVLIVALIRLRLSIGAALTTGAAVMGLWFGLSLFELAGAMARSLVAERTVTLCAVIALILVLSHAMEKTGQMKRLLEAFRGMSGNARLNLAIFPALIGLLPMPGGAIFSAPMVHEMSDNETLSPEHKTLINYWLRHIWEFSWPLYPGVILTVALSGIGLWTFVLVQLPLTLVSALTGYVVLLRPIPSREAPSKVSANGTYGPFIRELMPLLMVVAGALLLGGLLSLFGTIWPLLKQVKKEIPLIVSLVLSVWWVGRWNRLPFQKNWGFFFDKSLASMIFMIVGVMMFQGVLDDSRAVSEISQSLITANVPLTGVIILLPFLVGGIAGITVAFVGTTFPIIFSLLSTYGLADESTIHDINYHSGVNFEFLAYTVLAYVSGYLGVLLSPLHICLILTCEFFKTSLPKIYPVIAATGFFMFLILRSI
jgi:integral membrane protein (TIGR00529 family)